MFSQTKSDEKQVTTKKRIQNTHDGSDESSIENLIDLCENGTFIRNKNKSIKNICFSGNKSVKNYNKRLQRNFQRNNHLNKNEIGLENADFYCLNIKASLSTTSLSQQKEQQRTHGHNGIIAKIRSDRPYHSLKRNIRNQSDCKLNHKQHLYNKRYSWSGGHSYTPSGLCAGALNVPNGKDDLWGAIQTNYNYIMDTNLLENCKDTHGEIKGVPNLLGNPMDCCSKMLNVVERTNAFSGDAKELRQWLRKMEEKLQKAPTTSEATLFSITELQRLSQEHAVLYHQIVSYALVVRACIAKEQERRTNCSTLATLSNVGVQNENCDCRSLIVIENRNPSATHLSYKIISTKRNTTGQSKVASAPALLLKTQTATKKSAAKPATLYIESSENIYTKNSKSSANTQYQNSCPSEPVKVNTIIDNGLNISSSDSDDDFESLEKLQYRYYLIYLKAYEVQLLFDSIMREKSKKADCKDDTVQPILGCYQESANDNVYLADNAKTLSNDTVDLGSRHTKPAEITTEILDLIRNGRKCDENRMDQNNSNKVCFHKNDVPLTVNFDTLDTSSQNSTLDSSIDEKLKILVLEADQLVVDETAANNFSQTNCKLNMQNVKRAATVEEFIIEERNKKRVQDWLEHQPVLLMPARNCASKLSEQTCNSNHDNIKVNPNLCTKVSISTDTVPLMASLNKLSDEEQNKLQAETDTSEDFNDSIATCVRTTASYCTSNEQMGGSANVLSYECGSSNQSLNIKVMKRPKNSKGNRKSERPWSVSCLSQLNRENRRIAPIATVSVDSVKSDNLAIHSISESALDSLSPSPCMRLIPNAANYAGSNAVSTFKRRRVRKKKMSQNSAPQLYINAEGSSATDEMHRNAENTFSLKFKSCATISMLKSIENMKENAVVQVLEHQLLPMDAENRMDVARLVKVLPVLETDDIENENSHLSLLKDSKYRMGSLASRSAKKLNFFQKEQQLFVDKTMSEDVLFLMNDEDQQGGFTTGTDDHHSSFSETAWDDYQEKYNSENYSEGFDSDAARRLLEFGDDYRNFIDSQSDCCSSSLSAVNNIEPLSAPSINSWQEKAIDVYSKQLLHEQAANHAQQAFENTQTQRIQENNYFTSDYKTDNNKSAEVFELHFNNTLKALQLHEHEKDSLQESATKINEQQMPHENNLFENNKDSNLTLDKIKLTDGQNMSASHHNIKLNSKGRSVQSLRRSSESDTSIRRKKADTSVCRRRRSNFEKNFKCISAKSSTSDEDSVKQVELRKFLQQSRDRLESTRALKLRCSLLRKDDYVEVIGICRDNFNSLQSMLYNLSNSEAPISMNTKQIKDLLRSWRDLIHWNEIAMSARELLDEMICIKRALNRLGSSSYTTLDTESFIQIAIESLKNQKLQLSAYRSQMLRINASVHNWLIKKGHELLLEPIDALDMQSGENLSTKPSKEIEQQLLTMNHWDEPGAAIRISNELELHRNLRNEVSDMYLTWDTAESRINQQLDALKASLATWKKLDNGLSEFQQVLGEDRGTLEGLHGSLGDHGLVAKLLPSKNNLNTKQDTKGKNQSKNIACEEYSVPKFAASNSCLSDSGISDGGAVSDGGLSEREHRLNALRRLAKQLECTFSPSSAAMTSISARIASAEAELKQLQYICHVLIERTENAQNLTKTNNNDNKSHKESNYTKFKAVDASLSYTEKKNKESGHKENNENSNSKKHWFWRVVKFAFPLHLALIAFICITIFLEPRCCDTMNSYYISFSPQLRYIQGPPPC